MKVQMYILDIHSHIPNFLGKNIMTYQEPVAKRDGGKT
jgi:hypothetical protein